MESCAICTVTGSIMTHGAATMDSPATKAATVARRRGKVHNMALAVEKKVDELRPFFIFSKLNT